jgi:nucleoid DNA-binding protein
MTMAAAQRGPYPLTESELIGEVATRIGNGFSKKDVSDVVKALKAEITECIQLGHKVSLAGLVIFTPVAKPGRKKGAVVRNPFDGTSRTLRADEPDKFAVKARVSAGVKAGFPSSRTKDGQALIKQLAPVKRAAPKAAPAAAKPKAKGKSR